MQAGYADAQATAPAPHKAAFQAAQLVCDALAKAIAERQTAVSALHGSLTTRSSEASQPKGGAFERAASTALGDAFFTTSQQNVWNERAAVLRKNITAAYLRERTMERQGGAWSVPETAPAPTVPNAPDPVVGKWLLGGSSLIVLEADHTISGGRHGSWDYTCTTSGGRNYELHWQPPKDWVDYLVLSADGRMLDGHTRHDKPCSAARQ